jgi:hypothetical protein
MYLKKICSDFMNLIPSASIFWNFVIIGPQLLIEVSFSLPVSTILMSTRYPTSARERLACNKKFTCLTFYSGGPNLAENFPLSILIDYLCIILYVTVKSYSCVSST